MKIKIDHIAKIEGHAGFVADINLQKFDFYRVILTSYVFVIRSFGRNSCPFPLEINF